MTLDELIEALRNLRAEGGGDAPVRLVQKISATGEQSPLIDAQLRDGYHGKIVLLFSGKMIATMDWPEG
ncbi:MAG: hypothetical protein ACTHLC_05465 [Rhizobiaceae bacterium]